MPAATALMPTEAWRSVLRSMEPDPSLNRFFWPEKLTGAGFARRVLLNEPIDRRAKHESKIGVSALYQQDQENIIERTKRPQPPVIAPIHCV